MYSKNELIRIAILQWGAKTLDDGRLHIRFLCDGTLVFEECARNMLRALRCSDIRMEHGHAEPKPGTPWMDWRVDVSGIYPGEFPTDPPELEIKMLDQNWKDSACHRFLLHEINKGSIDFQKSGWWCRAPGGSQ